LLDRVHEAIRRRYYSRRTEEAYVHCIKRFIFFNGKRHPDATGEAEVTAFLNHLASERSVAAATQNQALSAILFLYRDGGSQDRRSSATDLPLNLGLILSVCFRVIPWLICS
jgi:site-specific recombinase XerD